MGGQSKEGAKDIYYSDRYSDDVYEYRHVVLPKTIADKLPDRLLTEEEWRALGVQQSPGWVHYAIHRPEPHIMLFKRPRQNPKPVQQQLPRINHNLRAA